MRKTVVCVLVMMLVFSVLIGFSGCKRSPKCSRCDMYITPMNRVISGGEDFYLCNDCSYGFVPGAYYYKYYYKYNGSCYFCKNEAFCVLTPAEEQDDEFNCLMLVCDACKVYKKEHGRWRNKREYFCACQEKTLDKRFAMCYTTAGIKAKALTGGFHERN